MKLWRRLLQQNLTNGGARGLTEGGEPADKIGCIRALEKPNLSREMSFLSRASFSLMDVETSFISPRSAFG